MTSVAHVTAMYATKRRRRNSKNVRTVCSKDSQSKSNPSKRHRERLNQELDTLASLLPFEQSVLSKLDKLSILRLSVSYLRTKSYFQAALAGVRLLGGQQQAARAPSHHYQGSQFGSGSQQREPPNPTQPAAGQHQHQLYPAELRVEGDLIVQALNGFLLILTCDGEVFYTSHTVETYLGFHQSDICHQSVYELVHSEDREELMQQLKWNSMIPTQQTALTSTSATSGGTTSANQPLLDGLALAERGQGQQMGVDQQQQQAAAKNPAQMSMQEILASADHRHLLERNFTVRFRCLLDNTSGFLRLDIRGRIKVLHGQQNQHNLANSASNNKKQQQQIYEPPVSHREPLLAFFGVCIPFGPPSLLEMPSKDSVFKSKHRLDLSLISMDSRGKQLLGLHDLNSSLYKQHQQQTSGSSLITGTSAASTAATTTSGKSSSSSSSTSVKLEGTGKSSSTSSSSLHTSGGGSNSSAKHHHNISAYDLVHHDDLSYMASAHQELLKTGASGLIAYRMIIQTDGKHQWLQTSAKLYYKNSKPDFILCTHRPLMEEEGRDLLGKRTMDFKALGHTSGSSSSKSKSPAGGATGVSGGTTSANGSASSSGGGGGGGGPLVSTSSPALSGASSRSLTNSLSPTVLNEDQQQARQAPGSGNGAQTKEGSKRKFNYDLNLNHQTANSNTQQQYLDGYESHELMATSQQEQQEAGFNHHETNNGVGAYGDIFYDMDATTGRTNTDLESVAPRKASTGKKKSAKSCSGKNQGSSNKKQHLPADSTGSSMKKSKLVADQDFTSNSIHLEQNQHQQQHHQQHSHHHHQQQQQQHQQGNAEQALHYNHHVEVADPSSYPAIQAAAVYAASLGHHSASGMAHQGAYGANHHHQLGYNHHHNHAAAAASQSLYGATSIVSPSTAAAAAYSQHHQHHSHLHHHHHHLDSSSYQSTAGHYGAFTSHHQAAAVAASGQSSTTAAAAAASSFLPAEHLLHHYSQSARSAALAAWPNSSASSLSGSTGSTVSATSGSYYHQSQQSAGSSHTSNQQTATYNGTSSSATSSGSSGWGASAVAAAALVASANGTAAGGEMGKRDLDSYSPSSGQQADSYGQQVGEQQQYHQQQQQQQQFQQQKRVAEPKSPNNSASSNKSSLSAVAAAVMAQRYQHKARAGPASLTSDGSAHRSPLSSSESSNGSGSLAAQAMAATSDQAAAAASIISPSAYYLAEHGSHHHHHHHQQAAANHHQQQSFAAAHHHNQQLAAYHQNQYAAVAHQYGDTAAAAAHFNQHQYHHTQYHHQQASSEQHASSAAASYFQGASGSDLSVASNAAAAAAASVGHHGSASAMAAVKLYGANGETSPPLVADNYNGASAELTYATLSSNSQNNMEAHKGTSRVWSEDYKIDLDEGETLSRLMAPEGYWLEAARQRQQLQHERHAPSNSCSMSADETTSMRDDENDKLRVNARHTTESDNDERDPLAKLISSTIGDIMLDIAPKG